MGIMNSNTVVQDNTADEDVEWPEVYVEGDMHVRYSASEAKRRGLTAKDKLANQPEPSVPDVDEKKRTPAAGAGEVKTK